VLVCHGGVIRVIIAHLLSIDWGNANLFKQLQIDYASHSRVEVQKNFLPLIKYIGSH
jgi:alpha-ribazole phosphatase